MINQTFGVICLGAGAGEVGFLEPEVGDAVVVSELKLAVNVFKKTRAGQREGLIDFIANLREVRAAGDELRSDVERAGACAGILE